MVRAVFEGVALNSAWLLGAVEKYCKRPFPSLAFVGGGANSDLWSQIHADAMGRTIRQIEDPVLANVRGAGLLTLLALGHLTVADIPGTVTVKATYEPDPAAGEVYAALLKEFVNLYEKTKAIHKRLNGRRLLLRPRSRLMAPHSPVRRHHLQKRPLNPPHLIAERCAGDTRVRADERRPDGRNIRVAKTTLTDSPRRAPPRAVLASDSGQSALRTLLGSGRSGHRALLGRCLARGERCPIWSATGRGLAGAPTRPPHKGCARRGNAGPPEQAPFNPADPSGQPSEARFYAFTTSSSPRCSSPGPARLLRHPHKADDIRHGCRGPAALFIVFFLRSPCGDRSPRWAAHVQVPHRFKETTISRVSA